MPEGVAGADMLALQERRRRSYAEQGVDSTVRYCCRALDRAPNNCDSSAERVGGSGVKGRRKSAEQQQPWNLGLHP